jgi:hypothetical protein
MAPRVDLPGPLGVIDIPPGWRKPCSVNHWGEGVLVAATPTIDDPVSGVFYQFSEIPVGIVHDGRGGAFVLSTSMEGWGWSTQGLASVRHVDASGVAGPVVLLTEPRWWPGVIGQWAEAAIVAGPKRTAIVAAFDYDHRMTAQRYDVAGVPQWRPRLGVRLSSAFSLGASGNVVNLAGEEDGRGGAIFAWREGTDVRAQRISSTGVRRWGAAAPIVTTIAGAAWPPPQPWMQLVSMGNGGAIVVAPQAAGTAFRYVATPISPAGVPGPATTLVASTPDDWRVQLRLRVAVPDGDGGLFLGYEDGAGAVRLLRYSPAAGVRWDIVTGMAIQPQRLAVHEDDRRGVLVGGIGGAPEALRLRRYDASGAVGFDIDAGVVAPLLVTPVPAGGLFGREWRSRSVIPLPDGAGGAIVECHEVLPYPGPAVVITRCFDATGRLVSAGAPLTSDDWGQAVPRAVAAGAERAIVAYLQYENLVERGRDVSAQRVGCCAPAGEVPPLPPFGCEIVPLPPIDPFRFDFRLPCGNRERGFGVIPLSRFVTSVPGLRAPGGLASHDVEAPRRARLVFRNVPDGVAIMLCTLDGKRVAGAKRPGDYRGMLVLDFAPKADDLLLVVSATGKVPRDATISLDVAIDAGAAPRAPRRVASKRGGRTARR